jgi:hypothetical protein
MRSGSTGRGLPVRRALNEVVIGASVDAKEGDDGEVCNLRWIREYRLRI